MRILLINPWQEDQLPPPSIGYLQAILKNNGIDVIARNLQDALSLKDDFDIVGVSFHSFSVQYAKLIRDTFKGRLICGGHHPSAMPDQMLSIGYDQVIVGEGEEAIIDVVNGNTDVIVNKTVKNINSLPFPDYTGLKFTGQPHGIPIISSRGCPFSCVFCGSSSFWEHKYKARSADNVLAEIDHVKRQGYRTWIMYDDNFLVNHNRATEICRGLDGTYDWETVARAEDLNAEICDELFRSGCRKIHLGIESLSQDSLDRMGKHTTIEKMLKGIEAAENAGIGTMSLMIVGMPGDTFNDIRITHETRLRSRITQYGTNIVWILPGTDIHRRAKEYGFNDDSFLEGISYYTYEHSIEELTQWAGAI